VYFPRDLERSSTCDMNTVPSDLSLASALSHLLVSATDPGALLVAAARSLGTYLNSEACLLATSPASDALVGAWCELRSRQRCLAQLQTCWQDAAAVSSKTAPLRCLHRCELPQGGVLIVGRREAGDWTEGERAQFEPAAAAARAAIAHAQLLQQAQTQQRYQELFHDLSRALHAPHPLEALMRAALAGAARAIAADRSAILTLKYCDPLLARANRVPKARVTLASAQTADGIPPFAAAADFALADCPYCTAAWQQAPAPLFVTELAAEPSPLDWPNCAQPHWLIQPLLHTAVSDSRPLVLGFLVLQRSRPAVWPAVDLEAIASVGLQISAAMVRDRALQRVQSVVDERTAQLKGSLDMQAKLYEKSRQQVEQLRQLLASKNEFLDAVSHELCTPLTTMKMAIRFLRQPELSPERRAKYLDMLEQEWQREYSLIQDLLALQKLESNQVAIDLQRFNFKELIEPLFVQFRAKWQEKGLTLNVSYTPSELASAHKPVWLYSDADSLRQTVQELLTNAGKYSEPETSVTVAISQAPPQYQLQLSVTNFGRGIALDEQELIFEKFARGRGVTEEAVPGTGLGLALVKCLVQHLNGTIEVQSQGAAGDRAAETCFTLTLPPPPPSM